MEQQPPQHLSTSALAKELGIPSQQLFVTLKDFSWIRKVDDGWVLTKKGEYEGGEYIHSKRYGRYIVWPHELTEHPLFKAMEDARTVSATALGRPCGLTAREVNRLLAELGWIKHGFQGWELTPLGEKCGGVQLENDNSGTFYVVWPSSVSEDKLLSRQLQSGRGENQAVVGQAADLFAGSEDMVAMDGHSHSCQSLRQVCQWLYLSGLAHACQRRLPCDEDLYADFYLPLQQLYIECWSEQETSKQLSQRMRRKEVYQTLSLQSIDIEAADYEHLDEVLVRHFRKLGIRIY